MLASMAEPQVYVLPKFFTDSDARFVVLDPPAQIANAFPSKEALERAQLEAYRVAFILRHGRPPFEDVRRGGDPPDFVVDMGAQKVPLDCAALALAGKRRSEAIFDLLRDSVARHSLHRLDHLSHCDVYLWFAFGQHPAPPASHKADSADIILSALATVTVDRKLISEFARQEKFPETFPPGMPIVDGGWFGFQVTPRDDWQPRTELGKQLGFNLFLHYPVHEGDIHGEVQRLITGHDQPGTDYLLLVAGGPNQKGMCFPAEAIAADVFFCSPPPLPLPTQYIRLLTVFCWSTGRMIDVPVAPTMTA